MYLCISVCLLYVCVCCMCVCKHAPVCVRACKHVSTLCVCVCACLHYITGLTFLSWINMKLNCTKHQCLHLFIDIIQ